MNANLELAFIRLGLHMSFVVYAAQGEATYISMALCRRADDAQDVLTRHIDDWLHPGIVTVALDADTLATSREALTAAALIPDTLKWDLLRTPYLHHFFASFVVHLGD